MRLEGNFLDTYKKNKLILFTILFLVLVGTIACYFKNQNNNDLGSPNNEDNISKEEVLLMLVNYDNIISSNYHPSLIEYDGYEMSKYIFNDFKEMIKETKKDGYNIEISSAYRSNSEQKEIYDEKYKSYLELGMNKEDAKYLTEKEVAIPGYSEHATGLALDLTTSGDAQNKEQFWNYLKENSYKYGFINRYPEEKEKLTKIKYEPWHFRYVGKNHSKHIHDNNLCLEEYLQNVNK